MRARILVKFGGEAPTLINAWDKRGHPIPAEWATRAAAEAYLAQHWDQWGADASFEVIDIEEVSP